MHKQISASTAETRKTSHNEQRLHKRAIFTRPGMNTHLSILSSDWRLIKEVMTFELVHKSERNKRNSVHDVIPA